jgi:hypothetical protein
LKQAIDPTKTAGLTRYDAICRVGSRDGRVIQWLRGVSGDGRIGILHRFALIGIGLHHRRDEPDAVANAIGLDRACVLRAIDIGIRCGWLLADFPKHSGLLFTFPTQRNAQRQAGRA